MSKRINLREAKYALARKDFFSYCNLTASSFYKPSRQYLIDLCNSFQEFIEDKYGDDVLVINIGPRHGKSRTAGKFVEWIIGQDHTKKIMTGSYNETLSTTFSKSVRNAIQEVKADEDIATLNDVFPGTEIKRGDGAMNLWGLVDGYQNYLATSPGGTATGFGADIILIDDLIKNSLEANNANVLDGHWEWFVNTMLSRLETGGKIILIMTRWHSKDLAGRALEELPKLGYKVKHVNMKTLQDDGTMLCDEVLTRKEYDRKVNAMSPEIASANYQQEPIDLKGKLYSHLKEYDSNEMPTFRRVSSYTDTADTGSDYLSSFIYGETMDNEAYILDVIYTKEPMEITEPLLAKKLHEHQVNLAIIESNNGGRGYARSVERILKNTYKSNKTIFKWFHQSKNKQARILSNATWVMDHIYFPKGWRNKWPELYESLNTYQKEGKNKNDDSCFVAGTKVATIFGEKNIEDVKEGEYVITPFGLRKVIASGCTGTRKVVKRIGLTATPNHKVFSTNRGFSSLDTFTRTTENDIISLRGLLKWRYKKLLCSMELRTDLWGRENITLVNQKQMKDEKMLKDFMWRFGNLVTKKKFLKAITFTTKTATLSITTLATWNLYKLGNIYRNTLKTILNVKSTLKGTLNTYIKQEKKLMNGIEVKKEELGTENTQKKLLNNYNHSTPNVNNVAKNTKRSIKHLNFVLTNVGKIGDGEIGEFHTQRNAKCVGNASLLRKGKLLHLAEKRAPKCVQTNSTTETEKVKVYNLTVEKDHVYYAQGLLVSNCDAITGIAENVQVNNQTTITKKPSWL